LGRVHIGHQTYERPTARQLELLSKFTSYGATQCVDVAAIIREEHALRRDAKPAIRVARPATAPDPRIGGSAGADVEAAEDPMLKVEWTRHLKASRDRVLATEREPRH